MSLPVSPAAANSETNATNAALSERDSALTSLLQQAGWAQAQRQPLPGDASTRRYVRLVQDGRKAMLMDAPPRAESAVCPPGASESERLALGYNATARLAGSKIEAFVAIAGALRAQGLSAPEIIAHDQVHGFALLEDLGDALFADQMVDEGHEWRLYAAAIDALTRLHEGPPPVEDLEHMGLSWPLLGYDTLALLAEVDLLVNWFALVHLKRELTDQARLAWRAAWTEILAPLQQTPPVLVLRDYHAQNLIWLPERHGAARAGLLDFQDGLAGHPAYDLVSLTEDARRDVAPQMASRMVERYLAARPHLDPDRFRADYAVLGAQRNAKIIGIFARLCYRDGKARYLDLLPRVLGYFRRDLQAQALAPVRDWLLEHVPEAVAEAGT